MQQWVTRGGRRQNHHNNGSSREEEEPYKTRAATLGEYILILSYGYTKPEDVTDIKEKVMSGVMYNGSFI